MKYKYKELKRYVITYGSERTRSVLGDTVPSPLKDSTPNVFNSVCVLNK